MARGKKNNGKQVPAASGPVPVNHNEQGPTAVGKSDKKELTAEQRNDLVNQHLTSYVKALAAKKTADANFKNACKLAKAELGDTAIDEIKDKIELATPEGEARFKGVLARMLKSAKVEGVELDLIGMPMTDAKGNKLSDKESAAVERARLEGVADGKAGKDASQKYALDTPKGQAYMTGWNDGQAENRAKLAAKVAADEDFEGSAPSEEAELEPPELEPMTTEDDY